MAVSPILHTELHNQSQELSEDSPDEGYSTNAGIKISYQKVRLSLYQNIFNIMNNDVTFCSSQ